MIPGPGFPGEALRAAMGTNPTMLNITSVLVYAEPGVLARDACTMVLPKSANFCILSIPLSETLSSYLCSD